MADLRDLGFASEKQMNEILVAYRKQIEKRNKMGLKREQIVNGQLVFNEDDDKIYHIQDVGLAHRSIDDEEKQYSIVDIVTHEIQEGICEHSHVTDQLLKVITKEKALMFLSYKEGDLLVEYGKIQKKLSEVQLAISELEENGN